MDKKEFYDLLVKETGYQDSYEDFDSLTATPSGRKDFYDVLVEETGYQDDYDFFESIFAPDISPLEIGKASAQATGQATKEQPKVAHPVTAVQASDRGPFYTTKAFGDWLNGQPNPQVVEQTKATNQVQASGQVTETPTAPSAPKAEDITTTKATAATAEAPKVETTANPVSALQKADGTPYKAEELQGIASQQQVEPTAQEAEQPTVQVGSVEESQVVPTETDQARLEDAKAKEAEGDQKAESKENAQSIEGYMSQMNALYGNKYAPQRTGDTQTMNLNMPYIEGEINIGVYRNWLDKATEKYVRNVALTNKMKELGVTSLNQAQLIEVENAIKNMSEKEIVEMLGEDGMKVLQGYVNSAKKAEERDDKNTGVIGRLFNNPTYRQYLERFVDKDIEDNEAVSILSYIMRGADIDLGTMPQEQAERYIEAKALRIDSLFDKSGIDYFINAKRDDKVANGMYQCGMIYDKLFNSNAPNEAIELAKRTIKSIEKNGQLGTEDGVTRLNDVLTRAMEFGVVIQDLTPEDEKRILNELRVYFGGRRKITTIEDVAFSDDYGWELLKNNVIELKQAKGMIQSLDDNIDKLNRLERYHREYISQNKSRVERDPYTQMFLQTSGADDVQMQMINVAREYYTDAEKLLNDSGKTGIKGFVAGFSNAIFDEDSWSFGFTDLKKNLIIRNALEKYHRIDSGQSKEQMSDYELALLDAFTTYVAAESLSNPSIAYNVGSGTAISIPYVLQIALTPTGGGRIVAKTLLKYAQKRVKSGLLKGIVKNGAKGVGILTNSATNVLTTGLGNVASKATEVSPKVVNVGKNEDGNLAFGGVNEEELSRNKVDAKKVAESIYSQFKTYLIETTGGVLLDKVFVMPKWAKNFFDEKGIEIPKNETWEGALNRMGYNKVLSEFGEEIMDQMAEVPVSELTLDTNEETGVFSGENIATTALTTMVLSTLLNVPNAMVYKSKSARMKADVENLANSGQKAFGKQWDGLQAKIDGATFGEMSQVMSDISNDKNMSSSQKKHALKYAVAKAVEKEFVTRYEGEQMARENSAPIKAQAEIEDATIKGLNVKSASESRELQVQEKVAGNSMAETLGVNGITEAEQTLSQRYGTTDASELAISVAQDADLSEGQKRVIQDYLKVKATNLAKQNKVEKDNRKAMAEARQGIADKTHGDGSIYQAELKNGETTYIKVGDVSTDKDGKLTTNKDGDNIIVVDENGNKDMISPKEVVSITPIDVDSEIDMAMRTINAEYAKNLAIANGEYAEGDVVTLRTYNGEEQGYSNTNVTIVRESQGADGTIMIECITEDGSTLILSKDDFYKMADGAIEERVAPTVQKTEVVKPKEQATQSETTQEQSTFKGITPTETEQVVESTAPQQEQAPTTQVAEQAPQVESAEVVEESTEQPTAIEPGAMVSLADGSIGEVVSMPEDGRVIVEHEDGSTNEYNVGDLKVAEKPSAQTSQAPQAPTAPQVESTPVAEQAEPAQQETPTATPTAQVAIPTDENGKKVYEQAPVEATINDIYNDPELDEEEADAYVQAKIDGATKRIEAIDKKKPKMGEDRNAYVAERDAWRAERGAEQASLDYWQGVQAQRAKEKSYETDGVIDESNEPIMSAEESVDGEGGSNVLQGEQLDNNRGNERIARESQGSNVSGIDSNATSQEEIAEAKEAEQYYVDNDNTPGVVGSSYARAVLPSNVAVKLGKMAKALGVSIRIVPTMTDANAKIQGKKVVVAWNAEQIKMFGEDGLWMVVGHELTHRIKALSKEAYEDFASVIESIFPKQFKQRMINTRLAYSRKGMKISDAGLREEVVSDLAGILMTDDKMMAKFLDGLQPKSTKQQILDILKDMFDAIKNIFKDKTAMNIAKAERVLLDAMKKANKVVAQDETTEADSASEKLSIIGESGASALDRAEEATIRMDNLAKARKMERFDYPTKSIRMATGWERGADGKWRYEIDDVKLKKTTYENTETTLGELVDNAELFSAYPSLMDLKVVFTDTPNNTLGRTYSQYAEDENGQGAWIPTQISLNNLLVWDDAETESVLAHEIQHAIQSIEGFVNGGDSANKENYHRLAGEVEARNVQSRMGMTPDQRRATLLAETEDVARKDQIFLVENSGVSAMAEDAIKTSIENAVGGEMEVDGESVPTRFSIRSVVEGGGLTTTQTTTEMIDVDEVGAEMFDIDRHMTDGDGNVIFTIGDKVFSGHNPVSVQDLKETESALSMMVEDAVEYGTITKQRANEIFKTYADIINMYLTNGLAENGGYANLADKWLWVGETAYKTVSKNADDQYLTSLDITRVCKKNEAIIRAISEMQKRLGYGITPAQIMDLYLESNKQGYQVPCPVCYVFSRYLRNGRYATAIINGMKKYGKHLPGQAEEWTAQQWAKELEKQEAIKENTENVIDLTNADIAKLLNEIDDLGEKLMKGNLSKKEETLIKKQILAKDAQYRAALNVESQRALTNWIKSFAIRKSKGEWVLHEDAQLPTDMKDFEEHALDLRKSAEAMRRYPGIQRLRNSGGSASGKEVTFEGNNDLGEVISAVGKSSPEKAKNVYQEVLSAKTPEAKAKARQEAKNRFAEAVTYAQQQSLRGGQRMWSWSDNIEALSPDVAVNLIQMELLGGAVQTYSKQLEGINLVARMGAYVNGSLMAKDAGYAVVDDADIEIVDGKPVLKTAITETINESTTEGVVQRTRTLAPKNSPIHVIDGVNYVLIFDDIVGIDPFGRDVNGKHMKGLFELNNELDKAGNIMVGMNDTHIKTAMADDRVFFIIPWHASGQSTHILKQMLNILGAKFEESDATDYTDMQSDKWSFAKGVPSKLIEMWNDTQFTNKDCAFGGIETEVGGLTKQQIAYRELRNKMFSGAKLSKADLKHIKEDMFLRQVYEKLESRGLKEMTTKDKEHIYPYEYWDESSTYDNADVNGERYIEYCRRLGVRPKFSGKWGNEWSNTGDFTKDKGYWKLLIDRRMYDTKGEYQDLTAIDSKGFSTKLVDPEWTKQQFVVTKVADEQGTMSIVDAVIETEESRTGTIPQTDYELDMGKAVKDYQKARSNAEKLADTKYSLRSNSQEVADIMDEFTLSQANQDDFSYALMEMIAGQKYSANPFYKKLGDVWIRVKEHSPNWSNFVNWETGDAVAPKILNVTIGDYDNTDYRRFKQEYDSFVEEHPETTAVNVVIEDGTSLSDSISLIHEALKEKGIDFEFAPNYTWVKYYKNEDDDIRYSLRTNSQEVADIVAKAKADGTYMKAPNGEPTNLTEEQWANVRTKAFKDWFGDWENDSENASKVVDENGEPMVVYHQTNRTIYRNVETGENWDDLDWRERQEWEERDDWDEYWEEEDFYAFNRKNARTTNEFDGFFFAPKYDEYHEYGDRTIEVFLNIRKPASREDYHIDAQYNDAGQKERIRLQEEGYDGVIREEDGVVDEYVAFEPNQIKSATDNVGTYSSEDNDTRYSLRSNSPFYSNAEYAVENIKQGKATPEQWLAMIQKNGGLKAGEDKWLGLSDWLNEKGKRKDERGKSVTLTKEEVLEFIKANQIVVEEVEYIGADKAPSDLSPLEAMIDTRGFEFTDAFRHAFGFEYDDYFGIFAYINDEEVAVELYNKDNGTNLKLDKDGDIANEDYETITKWASSIMDEAENYVAPKVNIIEDTRFKYTTEGLDNKREIALVVPTVDPYNQNDEIHFGDAGGGRAVAWVRFGETTDEDGNRVLVIDEIQSKRHQDGREKGYRNAKKAQEIENSNITFNETREAYNNFLDELKAKYGYTDMETLEAQLSTEEFSKLDDLRYKLDILTSSSTRVPDAPFDKNWQELAMKRMLRYAAENGFDKVAWTTGAQQAERYGMSNVVEGIDVAPYKAPGAEDVLWFDIKINAGVSSVDMSVSTDGNIINGGGRGMNLSGEKLSNVVGKELADKILSSKDDITLQGDNLRLGGEGMKGFYDKMLPSFMNKYGKKWGVKVGEVTMPELQEGYQTMHSVDVTDAMRDSVMEGQPLFSLRSGVVSTESALDAMKDDNPKGWESIKDKLRGTPIWNEVAKDANYTDDDAITKEALSRLKVGIDDLTQEMTDNAKGVFEKAEAVAMADRMRRALNEFDAWVEQQVAEPTEGEGVKYSLVSDPKLIAELDASPKRIGYRNVVMNEDGTFGSPMASGLRNKGKGKVKTSSFALGEWEQAEENPDLANENGKINLVKPDGKSVDQVDYNPYIHNRVDKVNAQFKQAWERPNLVYVETEISLTDLESGYHADKAKLPVGVHSWSNGDLILSRYDKPIRVVPWEEVADDWVERFGDRGVEFDIVPPALLPILVERGVEILPPHKGMGKNCIEAYEQWKAEQEGETKYSLRGVLHPKDGGDIDGTREEYDKRVKTTTKKFEKSAMTFFNFMEAFVDEMRSLDILQRIVEKKYGIKLPSFENALDAENRSSSMALKEFEAFMDGEYDAMMQFVDRWIKRGETTQSINYYMIAKSGLERNREFTVRDAINELLNHEDESKRITKAQAEQMRKNYADERNALLAELKSGNIDYVTFNKLADKLARKYAFGHKIEDYSGLTGITGDENNFRQIAEDMVLEFEAKHGDAVVDFWSAVKDVTKAPVRKSYGSGLLSKSMYDKLTTMFEWYIPMRGFEEQTAEDVYSYIGADTGVFNPTVALAKGHTEVSDDPLAIMGNMMQSAILQGNRNAVKQRLLFMVRNHPVDVLTESRVWLVLHPDGTWVSSYPELSNDMSADQVAQAIAEHEAKMEKLAKDKKAKISNVNLDIDFKIEKASNISAHAIDVMLNGNHYVIYVNGNPRVAQAVNGQLKDKGTNWLYEVWQSYARWYTASKTSLDVNFMFPNVVRDIQHSTLMTIMDKGFIQGVKFFFNGFATIIPVIKGASGVQIKDPKMRKYWDEFVKYGGETGYAHLESVDDFKRKNEKRLKRMKGAKKATTIAKGTFKYIGSAFDYANRIAESSTRFNAYVSSRKSGADIYDAIRYAKDITVNFNRKGSSMAPGIFGAMANFYRFWMPFANPIIQGIYQFLKVGRRNKGRFFTICGVQMALGFVIPMVNEILFEAIGGDDEDKYINQPDYARRTNMMFYIGGKYIKIPLPPIFRELYGLGDIAWSYMKGLYDTEEATWETVNQIRSMFSLQGQSSMKGKEFSSMRFILPGHLAWIADIEENTTFTGQPLYKEGDFIDEQTPEYQKVYNGTWRYLVEWSRELNHFLGGTDDKAAEISSKWMNPAVWQHVISEFGGGPYKFVMDMADLVSPESNDEGEPAEFTWSKVPVAKRFVAEVGDRAETRLLNKQYYDYIDSFDDIEYEEKVYTKKAKMGSMEYAEKLNELILSPEYREYKVKNGYEKAVKDLNKYLNDPGLDKSDRKQVEDAIERFKREVLTEAPKAKNFPTDGASEKVKEKLDSIKDVVEDVIGDGNEQTKERNRVIRDAKSDLKPLNMEVWKEEQKDKVK